MPARQPDRTLTIDLTMEDGGRACLINGKRFPDHEPFDLRQGERVRLEFINRTMMFHPMHVHGHKARPGGQGSSSALVAVHTHETDGTIHIEADTAGEVFTLGQLFTERGAKLTPSQIGGVQVAVAHVSRPGRKPEDPL